MIHITTAANENFAPGLLVTVASALSSLDPRMPVTLHFLNGGISKKTRRKLLNFCTTLHPDCRFVNLPINEGCFSGANLGPGNSFMTYARLLLGSLIQSDKVIYVDADIVILRDLAQMWNLDMEGKCVLAVEDRAGWTLARDCPLDLSKSEKTTPYFNAGYLMIDLKLWRESSIEQQALEMATSLHCVYHDQTILNYLFRFDRKLIGPVWNWQVYDVIDGEESLHANYHFIEKLKPWLYWGSNLKHRIWRFYYAHYVGSLTELYASKKGLRALLLGMKERLVRWVPCFRRVYFSYLRRHDSGSGEIESIIRFYENSSLQVPWGVQNRAFRAFCQSMRSVRSSASPPQFK